MIEATWQVKKRVSDESRELFNNLMPQVRDGSRILGRGWGLCKYKVLKPCTFACMYTMFFPSLWSDEVPKSEEGCPHWIHSYRLKAHTHRPIFTGSAVESVVESADPTAESADLPLIL